MAYMKSGTNLLFNNTTGDIVGMKDPDGSELYFARIPHVASFYDVSDQTASANTATPMECDTVDISNSITLVDNSKITFSRAAIYNIQFSAQFKNTDNSSEYNISIWLAKNGNPVDNSNTEITIPRKHGGGDGFVVAAWNFFVTGVAGDYYQIMWSTPSTLVSLEYRPTQTSPVRPAVPSVILTVNEVDGTMP